MEKKILIVGSNSFIAKSITRSLQDNGYICISSTRKDLDIENDKSIIEFSQKNKNLKIDGLVFCQGINPEKNTKETTSEHITRMLRVNIAGPILLMKHLHANFNPHSLVLFFSSIAATKGSYDPAYAAAKSAMSGLIQSLAHEFSTIRFNAIALGLVENSPVYNQMTPDFREKHRKNMIDGKFIQTEDILSTVLELINNTTINKNIVPLTGAHIV